MVKPIPRGHRHRAIYERVFETILREHQIPYIAINDRKRPIVHNKKIKNFDFIVYSKNGKYLVDTKGTLFPYEMKSGYRIYWENWIKKEDSDGLLFWQQVFGGEFISLLAYVYLLADLHAASLFKDIYEDGSNLFGLVAITLSDYMVNRTMRAERWDAIYVPKEIFGSLVKPLSYFLPELHSHQPDE